MLLDELKNKHQGEDVYIIGKGPSLQYLTKDMIGEGVVITINDAIVKIEELNLPNKIYAMEKDGWYVDNKPCFEPHDCSIHSIMPKEDGKTTLLVHKHESLNCLPNFKPRLVFDNEEFGLHFQHFSALSCIQIAKLMGCKKFYFISFDAYTHQDASTYIPGKGITGVCHDYLRYPALMQPYLKDLDYKFIIPNNINDLNNLEDNYQ